LDKKKNRLPVKWTIEYNGPNKRTYFLVDLLKNYNPKIGCEVGTHCGRTTYWLLDAFPELTMYSIDYNINLFYNDKIKEKYGERLIPIQGNSHNVHDQIKDNSLDFVFIDASHDYHSVKGDIEYYTSKLKPNGWLCGHDIDFPGVNKAVNELLPNNFDNGPNNVWFTCLDKSVSIPFKKLDN
jgi:predicted O-methyltransferase YrrM